MHRFSLMACSLALVALLSACGASSSTSKSPVAGSTATASSATSGGSSSSSCKAGVEQINGITTRQFCGPAKATLSVQGQNLNWSGGECGQIDIGWGLNIGRIVLGSGADADALRQKYNYFGIAVTSTVAAGTSYDGAIVAGVYNGVRYSVLQASVTFADSVNSGTFTGTTIDGNTVNGTFSCQ